MGGGIVQEGDCPAEYVQGKCAIAILRRITIMVNTLLVKE